MSSAQHKSNKVVEYYDRDIVYRFDRRQRIAFGVVVDSYSSLHNDTTNIKKGQLRVLWLNSCDSSQVCKQERVKLKSRSIVPGDIVRRLEQGKETQRGYCRSFKQYVSVQVIGTDKIIDNVSHERLLPINSFNYGTPVCMDDKVGRVANAELRLTMISKCGSIVQILSGSNVGIEDYWHAKNKRLAFEVLYHPGQAVVAVPSQFDMPVWIKKSKHVKRNFYSRLRFIVQKVELVCLTVEWQPTNGEEENNGKPSLTKQYNIFDKDIPRPKPLELIEDYNLEVMERRLLKISAQDITLRKRDWILMQTALYRTEAESTPIPFKKKREQYLTRNSSKSIINTICRNLRNLELERQKKNNVSDDEDGWFTVAEDEVEIENNSAVNTTQNTTQKMQSTTATSVEKLIKHFPPKPKDLSPGGIIAVEPLCMETKVTVVWQDGTVETDIPSTELYYSISLDDHEFFPGEWVVLDAPLNGVDSDRYGVIQSVNFMERTASIKWFTYSTSEKKPVLLQVNEMSVYDINKHPHFGYRPGNVVYSLAPPTNNLGTVIDSCPQGFVIVKWLTGEEQECWPQDIRVLPENSSEFSESDEADLGEMSLQMSWETESIESLLIDNTYAPSLQRLASRLEFIKGRIDYLRAIFKHHTIEENFPYLRDLLTVYHNSSYLDKLLDTSIFSIKSKQYVVLLRQIRDLAVKNGLETITEPPMNQNSENSPLNDFKINETHEDIIDDADAKSEASTSGEEKEEDDLKYKFLCTKLLTMLHSRMEVALAEVTSRINTGITSEIPPESPQTESTIETPKSPSEETPCGRETAASTPKRSSLTKTLMEKTYVLLDEAPKCHRFYKIKADPIDMKRFFKSINYETKLLNDSLPPGVWVYSYANRFDLLSAMIRGPANTPYEDGLFLFDIQLSNNYPKTPPRVRYISYSAERLNPNLYVEGRVCVSLLGTWLGKGTEVWTSNSTLLQLIVSIQGLILVAEPYYNEAGYDSQCDSQQGYENSRTYNELVVLRLVQSMAELLGNPHEVFVDVIRDHFARKGDRMCARLGSWIEGTCGETPEFPLLPVSKGLKLSLNIALDKFRQMLRENREKIEESQRLGTSDNN